MYIDIADIKAAHEKFEIIKQGSIAKFSQSIAMKKFLLSTGDRILV